MRIRLQDIEEVAKELVYEEPTDELNPLFAQGPVRDYEFTGPATVRVRYYRAGLELFFGGNVVSPVAGQCARCLEAFPLMLDVPFSFVLVPRVGQRSAARVEAEDLDLSFYEGEEVDLSPLMREQIILALPTQPLCEDGCKGLCARCGANLNAGGCGCPAEQGDLRLAVLRNLKV